MKTILIASAAGGSARTTTAVRVAESLQRRNIPAGVVDLSPYPTAKWLVRAKEVFAVNGRAATTPAAIRALLNPYSERTQIVLVDTGRLDDPLMDVWADRADGVILTTRCDAFSLGALPATWKALEKLRKTCPGLKFLGFLPVMITQNDASPLRQLEAAAADHLLPARIPFDRCEIHRSQQSVLDGLDALPAEIHDASSREYDKVAAHLAQKLELQQDVSEEKKERGMFTKMWRAAAKVMGPKARVQGGANA